jgi:type IV fimbrial biogenesis protein FimT
MKPYAKHVHPLCLHRLGFTFIEVMVSLGVLAVLAALATPSFSEMVHQYQINTIRDELIASIQWARTEAIRQGTPIILIRHTACEASTANNDTWRCGWQAVVDSNRNSVANDTEDVSQTTALPAGYSVEHTGQGKQLIVNRWGQITPLAHRFTIIKTAEGTSGASTKTICISSGGRVRSLSGASCG